MVTGRSAFLSILADEGISHLFGNPGTTELPIMAALGEHPELRYVLGLQESVVLGMADGYARASGRLAACNVHVAPGLGHAMGALYNAAWYGSPVLVTAGQQEQGFGLTEPLLYAPLVPLAAPLVKWAVEASSLADLPRILRRAAKVATTPPTGPVFLSLPGDVLNESADLDLGHPTRVEAAGPPTAEVLDRLAEHLLSAERPVLVSGHEVATGDALDEVGRLAEVIGAPLWQQTVPCAVHARSEHPAFMGALPRSQGPARRILAGHDLLVSLGSDLLRMSVWQPEEPLPEGTSVVQVGQRDWELGKNWPAALAVRADVGETLRALIPRLEARLGPGGLAASAARIEALAGRNWSAQAARLREEALAGGAAARPVRADFLMARLVAALPADAVVVEEGLVSTRTLPQLLPLHDARGYYGLASGGLGFAMPGAIGVQLAQPGRPVVAVVGDGSAMYGIQALWTAAHLGLPVTYVICNNRSYRILKERLVAYQGGMPGNRGFVGMDLREPPIDFVGLAGSLGLPARRVVAPEDLPGALDEAFARAGPGLVEVMVEDGFDG